MRSTSCCGCCAKLARKPARSLKSPLLAASTTSPALQAVLRGAAAARHLLHQHAAEAGAGAATRAVRRSVAPARRGSSVRAVQRPRLFAQRRAPAAAACRRGARPAPPALPTACRPSKLCSALARCRCAGRWPRRSRRRPSARPPPPAEPGYTRVTAAPRASSRPSALAMRASTSCGLHAQRAAADHAAVGQQLVASRSSARLDGNREAQADVAGHDAARIEAGGVDADQFAAAG